MNEQTIKQIKRISSEAAAEYNRNNFSAKATRLSLDKIVSHPKVANVMSRLAQV